MISGKTILISGGTGTFGQAFMRYALSQGAKQVRIFSRDELKQSEMEAKVKDLRVKYICGDVRDLSSITHACRGADIVVHAAAMKRLETCEREPQEAVKTNVMGSINVINACLETGVKHAIALSSDKAVYPVNTYGKTKALMESVWIQSNAGLGQEHATKFSIVRYGNVLGSRGSVADIFRKQADEGVMRVTNPIMTRFFMPVEYATELVAFALENQQGGEIYVPVLKATSIATLATVIGKGVRVEITGSRPGEKVHEDLITEKEMAYASLVKGIVIVDPEYCIWPYNFAERKPFEFRSRSYDAKKLTDNEINDLITVAHKARAGL